MKRPRDTISQRELLYRYRILIDEATRTAKDQRRVARSEKAKAKILALANENPNSTRSIHVMWNIGKSRRVWLLDFLEESDWNGSQH